MVKKILILSGVFLGLSSMAIFEATKIYRPKSNEGSYEPIVVLELFTSQGCSSCPPADVLLQKAKREHPHNLFALSYHVDYWNYIGWKDPFSKPQFSKKQKLYNTKLGYPSNYTPEMVVNGREHFVGSNAVKLNGKIREYQKKRSTNEITVTGFKKSDRNVSFNYQIKGAIDNTLLRAVLVLDERTTAVKRGENSKRTLKNSNIVVQETYFDVVTDMGAGKIQIPTWINTREKMHLVLLIETTDLAITAAAKVTL